MIGFGSRGKRDGVAAEAFLGRARRDRCSQEDLQSRREEYARHPRWEVRNVAVKLAGLLRDRRHIPWLTEILADRTQQGFLRRNAATSLGQIGLGTDQAVEALTRALEDPYYEVRCQAAAALSQVLGAGTPEVEQALRHRLTLRRGRPERNFEVRMSVVGALGHLTVSPDSIALVLRALADPNWKVRRAAVEAVGRFAQREVLSPEEAGEALAKADLTSVGFVPVFPLRAAFKEAARRLHREDP